MSVLHGHSEPMTGAEQDAALRRLRGEKKKLIEMHNRNCETIRYLRLKMKKLEADKAYTIDSLQALLDRLAPVVVEMADDDNSEKPTHRSLTYVNTMRYWLRRVWESWATNPHQVPAHIYAMGFLVLLSWIVGNIAIGIYESNKDVGTEQGVKMIKGCLSAVPGAFQLMLYFFPPVVARF